MSDVGHTPGPWAIHSWGEIRSGDTSQRFVAQAVAINGDYVTASANAHLIAAAPDFLAVVQKFLALPEAKAHLEQLRKGIGTKTILNVWAEARDALAKATPQSKSEPA